MPLNYSEEQSLLRDSAKDYFTTALPVSNLRELRDEKDKTGYSTGAWKEMIDLGWGSITIPEEFGGLEFGYKGLGIILEQAGKTLAATPLLATCALGVTAIVAGGSTEHKRQLLPSVAEGKTTLALAVDEKPVHAPYNIACSAVKEGSNYILSGQKIFVLDGHVADELILVARTSGDTNSRDGITLFLVNAKTSGITFNRSVMVDSRNACRLNFDNVSVAETQVLGTVDQGAELLDFILDVGRICLSAEMLGSLQESFDRTVEYLKTREQFDVLIGSFQGLKHRAARIFCEVELAKSVVIAALTALDDGADWASIAEHASLAKAKVSEVFKLVSNETIQMHGGIGMTDEEEVGLFLKRARVAEHTFGDIRFHMNRWGELNNI
ncbi:MAG: acyl-CoA dehydrogenase family protein [Pseudomonadales bacterium]|nr:acyl-CoA dehydrogenase family protein [Pseudomonadales bacterium]